MFALMKLLKMNNSELSRHFGFDKDYFAVMKTTNRAKFYYIFTFDKDKVKSVNKYIYYIEELYSKVIDIYYSFDNPSLLIGWLCRVGVYQNVMLVDFEKTIFKVFDSFLSVQFNIVKKFEDIIMYYYLGEIDYCEC